MAFLTHGTEGTEYELGVLHVLHVVYRRKSCGGNPFEDLAMIVHLVLGHVYSSTHHKFKYTL